MFQNERIRVALMILGALLVLGIAARVSQFTMNLYDKYEIHLELRDHEDLGNISIGMVDIARSGINHYHAERLRLDHRGVTS